MLSIAANQTIPTSLTLLSPAKLNLFLLITGKRLDGYHNLQTVFQLLNYGDELTFTKNNSGAITIAPTMDGVNLTDNLIYKAATLLQKHTNQPKLGADIILKKKLPMGGGIGGGSSNAATTFVALNYLWQTKLSTQTLSELGHVLGADIPVFIQGKSAWAEGVGEQLTPITLPKKWFIVLTPNCHVSTKEIFCHKRLTRDSSPINMRTFFERGANNDCQPLVESLFSQVKDTIDWLNQYGPAKMTGTGASVFLALDSKEKAESIMSNKPKDLNGFIAQGVNTSALNLYLPEQSITGV